ncbi:carboxypeptidase regulatory-like domain-containing protein [Haloterrigena salifodinae]|uniref:Carboxypeptidase regulatory-like domain-containing protein n=1 Tax=Haloterrigena salifodinae TaxID=2675099 RepID=A0A8T8E2E6_9EURY|nr:carboxypeptidase-like regulatory domain-containing protein [Haloterrigena salifodinae]QRV16034.1 carboxypeptidase regulatory-like domain-containing protein [Haloterrigena salifodinae]
MFSTVRWTVKLVFLAMIFLSIFAAGIIFATTVGLAQDTDTVYDDAETHTFDDQIVDKNGNPVAGARVTFRDFEIAGLGTNQEVFSEGYNGYEWSTTTDSEGRFQIDIPYACTGSHCEINKGTVLISTESGEEVIGSFKATSLDSESDISWVADYRYNPDIEESTNEFEVSSTPTWFQSFLPTDMLSIRY